MSLEVNCVSVRETFRCCCCECTVKIGTIIIGWLQLDLSVLLLLQCIASLVDVKRLFLDDARGPVIGILVLIGACLFVNGILIFSARRGIPVLALPYHLLGLIALTLMCLFIFKGVTHMIISPRDITHLFGNMVLSLIVTTQLTVRLVIEILLLYGAYRGEPMFMLPYVVLDPIGVVWVASLILLLTIYLAGKNIIPCLLVIPIIDSLFIGVRAYMWVIVYSYYRQLIRNICPRTEIPLQNVACAELTEAEPIVTPGEEKQTVIRTSYNAEKEDMPPVIRTEIVRVDKNGLWPSSREYLL